MELFGTGALSQHAIPETLGTGLSRDRRGNKTVPAPDRATTLTRHVIILPGTYTALVRAPGNTTTPATLEIHVLD